MYERKISFGPCAALVCGGLLLSGSGWAAPPKTVTVCADPGNMPLSNAKGEGFENKIAQELGSAMGADIHYYWRPSIERGLMRTTLSEGNCEVWLDMAADTEGAVILSPLYRSTFVLAYRSDKGIDIKSLDDPVLKKLRVGVYQVSAVREALADHGIVSNTVIHYLSHNADEVPGDQPSYQVEQVTRGELDVAAAWGPMAGYYAAMKHEPLVIRPVNLMEDDVQMEFDMALAVPRGRPELKAAIESAMHERKDAIRKILVEYGVPLVKCEDCVIDGDLPTHGPYAERKPDTQLTARELQEQAKAHAARLAQLRRSLAHGADPDAEMFMAIVAGDGDRMDYTLSHRADVNSKDGDGNTPLINATRFGFDPLAITLLDHKADPNVTDLGGWTALMYAAWDDDPGMAKALLSHGANISAADKDGMTPLAIAVQNGKAKSGDVLIAAGADVNAPVAKGGYTPLMLAAISGSEDVGKALLGHGAQVNAVNPGGLTALMIAVANEHPGFAELLINSGADVNARNEDGHTALEIAQAKNNDSLVKLLQSAAQRASSKSS